MCAICWASGMQISGIRPSCPVCQRSICLEFPHTPNDPLYDSACIQESLDRILCERCADAERVMAEEEAWLAILERRCMPSDTP